MMKNYAYLTAAVLIVAAQVGAAHADSLYAATASTTSGAPAPISYFTDPKAHAVGDIVTVVVTEAASGSSTGTTTGNKSEAATFGPGTGSILSLIRTFGLSGSETSKADGATNRADTLTATISCTVTSVLPNGNLMIQGSRAVGVNSENQTMTLTGMVRPVDISQGNTIASPLVANAKIKYSGKGPVSEVQHDGLVRQIFKYLF
jgi:flagellar L-ring protein precursor FlgH